MALNDDFFNLNNGMSYGTPNMLYGPRSPGRYGDTGFDLFSMEGMLGKNGWGGMALGALQGLMGGYMGMQQYGLAKDAMKQSQAQFNKNFNAQRKTLNTRMQDRQAARVASNPGAYQSVGDYMDENRI